MPDRLFSLKSKTIVITGASSGLGKGLASAYGDEGANLVITSRNISNLEDLAHEIELKGVKVLPVKTDVTKRSDVENLLKKAIEEFGGVDVLVNNAGMSIPGLSAENVSEKDMQTIMDTNFKGVFLCGTIIGHHMIEQGKGKIINMSSVLGQTTWPGASIYSASKAAIDQITKAWAIEWALKNVNVNALAPTFIVTEMNKHLFEQDSYRERVLNHLPMARVGSIDDLVGPAIFLASSASDFITGHILLVDGGWTCV